jgi:hypothetical protein
MEQLLIGSMLLPRLREASDLETRAPSRSMPCVPMSLTDDGDDKDDDMEGGRDLIRREEGASRGIAAAPSMTVQSSSSLKNNNFKSSVSVSSNSNSNIKSNSAGSSNTSGSKSKVEIESPMDGSDLW